MAETDTWSPQVLAIVAELTAVGMSRQDAVVAAIERLAKKSYAPIEKPTRKPRERKRIKRHSAKWSREQREWNKITKRAIEQAENGFTIMRKDLVKA